MQRRYGILTVDGNGHGLGQDVAILALEGGNLAQLVELEVFGADALGWLSLDELEVEAVGLCDGENGGGTGVALENKNSTVSDWCCLEGSVESPWVQNSR